MEELLILKIGGSVVTHKDVSEYTVREDILRTLFAEIALAKNQRPNMQIILIHGAGGHIHHLAHTYNLATGTQDNEQKKLGALVTHTAVLKLHAEIMKIGTDCSLPLLSIPTDSAVMQTNKHISNIDLQNIKTALEEDSIPVLYGDMVKDTELGMSICSGDAIAAYLSTQLPVRKILFATDVDGIYSDDPHLDTDATLVESITLSQIDTITLRGSHNTDTTGGLQGKITACVELFTHSNTLTEIHVFNGLVSSNYQKVLLAEGFAHSVILQ